MLTAEGAVPQPRRTQERIFRIEAAKNENKKSQGLLNREIQLATVSGLLQAFTVNWRMETTTRSLGGCPSNSNVFIHRR
jgi:hypothetical protein